MKSADTEFVGGPLDGKVLPILLSLFHNVPKIYKVPVPAGEDHPAYTLVYRRAKEYGAKGRWRWRYEYDPGTDTAAPDSDTSGTSGSSDGSRSPGGSRSPDSGGSAGAAPGAPIGTED